MKNLLKEKMLAGQRTLGTFFETGSSTVVECLGLAGLDYIIIDNEHGPFNPMANLDFVRAAKLYGVTPLARIGDISRESILRLLDVGAMGLIIPDVHNVEETEKIVQYAKYTPMGKRGIANTAGSGFWYEDYAMHGMPSYFETSNRETMIIPQCETVECLNNLEQILSVPGVDGIFAGPFDLSAAMGKPGELTDPEVQDALKYILDVCKKMNKISIIFSANEPNARKYFDLGYDSVTLGMDATMLVEAFKASRRNLL